MFAFDSTILASTLIIILISLCYLLLMIFRHCNVIFISSHAHNLIYSVSLTAGQIRMIRAVSIVVLIAMLWRIAQSLGTMLQLAMLGSSIIWKETNPMLTVYRIDITRKRPANLMILKLEYWDLKLESAWELG